MKKSQKIIIIILAAVAAASIATTTIIVINYQKDPEPTVEPEIVLDCPMTDGTVAYAGEDDKTALEILSSICELETKTLPNRSDIVVISIAGITATSPDYWAMYINGTRALLGPNHLKTATTDTIQWQLESLGN